MTAIIVDQLKSIVAKELDTNLKAEDIDADDPLLEEGLKLDSIALVNLISLVEKYFDFQFSDDELMPENFSTLNVLADWIAEKKSADPPSELSVALDAAYLECQAESYDLDLGDYRDLRAKVAGIEGKKVGPNLLLTQVGAGPSQSTLKFVWIGSDIARRIANLRKIDSYTLPSPGNIIKTQKDYIKKVSKLYADELEALCDRGPYVLGGYCFEGWFAFEVAQQLKQRQLEVPLVILLDVVTLKKQSLPNAWFKLCRQADDMYWLIRSGLSQLVNSKHPARKRSLASRVRGKLSLLFPHYFPPVSKPAEAETNGMAANAIPMDEASWRSASEAISQYHPQPYSGDVALLFAKDRSEIFRSDLSWLFPHHGWGPLVSGELSTLMLPTSHSGIHTDPDVNLAMEKILSYLDRLQ